MPINQIDSNLTGISYAEETSLKTLPGAPVWYGQEPNSYSNFGGDIKTVARAPINPTRQQKKGVVTDLDASGGYNTDFTRSNLTRLLQGFFFADAREHAVTNPLNGTQVTITGVDAAAGFEAAAGLNVFTVGDLVHTSGFNTPSNNGLFQVSAVAAGAVMTTPAPTTEAAPPAGAAVRTVGRRYAVGDVALAYAAGVCTLTATAGVFSGLGLIPGAWVFVGGDAAGNHFADNIGYARVSAISADSKTVTLDQTTWAPVANAGAGVALDLYVGTILRSESDPTLIKRRSYQIERTLGNDGNGTQSEYLIGAIANQFTLNVPQANKLNADLTFVACDNEQRDGTTGLKAGTRIASPGESAYNTTSDVYRIRMNIFDPANPNPNALFGYVSDAKIDINNNVSPNKAIGVLGAFDTSAGDFVAAGSVTAYFTTVAATEAVRNNADVGLYSIFSMNNYGMIFDIPLISLGGGRIDVVKDKPIMVPITPTGAQSKFGHTMLFQSYDYLPNLAMPS